MGYDFLTFVLGFGIGADSVGSLYGVGFNGGGRVGTVCCCLSSLFSSSSFFLVWVSMLMVSHNDGLTNHKFSQVVLPECPPSFQSLASCDFPDFRNQFRSYCTPFISIVYLFFV